MNAEIITKKDIEQMSQPEIEKMLSKYNADELQKLNIRLFGKESAISKAIEGWKKSEKYSEDKLRDMIVHVCKNSIINIRTEFEKAEIDRIKAERKKPFFVKMAKKLKQKTSGGNNMLTKNEVKEVNAVIQESMNDGIIDMDTYEILVDLVESCSEYVGLTDTVLEMVNEFITPTDDVVYEHESKTIDEIKLDIYEACRNGELDEEDRDMYIAILEAVEDSEEVDEEDEEDDDEKIDRLGDKKKTLKTVADIDENESKIKKIKAKIEEKKNN